MRRSNKRVRPWRTIRRPTVFVMPAGHGRSMEWFLAQRGGPGPVNRHHDRAAMSEAIARAVAHHGEGCDCVVILPPEAALHTRVSVPRAQRRYLQQSLPYVVESQLALPVESQHVVAGQTLGGDDLQALVVSRGWMDWITDFLATVPGLRPLGVYLETQLLAAGSGRDDVQLLWTGDRMIGSVRGSGFVCDRSDIGHWLSRSLGDQQHRLSVHCVVQNQPDDAVATLIAELETLVPEVAEPRRQDSEHLEFLALRWGQYPAEVINLLSGEYGGAQNGVRPVRVALAGATAAIMLMTGLTVWQTGTVEQIKAEAAALEEATETLYARATPASFPDYRAGSWRADLESALLATRESDPARYSLLTVFDRLKTGLAEQAVSVDEIRYNDRSGLLHLVVAAATTGALDRFRAALEQQSLSVTYSASQAGGDFRGDFRVDIQGAAS